jgi:nucleoside-diphosphate-sugar epimerase
MKRILLTGAQGFIGQHCIPRLQERGFEVHAVSRQARLGDDFGAIWHEAGLLEPGAARALIETIRPTHLLHLAWFVVPNQLISARENFDWVRSSFDLVRHFSESGGRRLAVCGSAYEYNWRYGYCTEGFTPTVPNTVYGACKNALHTMVEAYAGTRQISAAWPRVFFVYGPHEHPQRLVPSVVISLLRGEPARCSHGRQIRDYLHVEDVASGLVAVLDSEVEGPVNVSSGQATTLQDITLTIGRQMGRPELIQLGALPVRPNDSPVVIGANDRLTNLGWKPLFNLEGGLRQTIEWWRTVGLQQVVSQAVGLIGLVGL